MGFIARVIGTFAGQSAGSAAYLPATTAPRRAVSTPALARSPLRAGIFARFSPSNQPPELPLVRDAQGRVPSAEVRHRAVERLAPRLGELSATVRGLRSQLNQFQNRLEPALATGGAAGDGSPVAGAPPATTLAWAAPTNAAEARSLERRLARLENFSQALGDLAALRRQLDAGLAGSGGSPT